LDAGVGVEEDSEFLPLHTDLKFCRFYAFCCKLFAAPGVDHGFEVLAVLPEQVIALADFLQTVLHVVFAQRYQSVLGIAAAVY
jgi:hypothetical protein